MRSGYVIPLALALGACTATGRGAPVAQPTAALPATVTNAIGMEFALIQPGTFTVGRLQYVCPVRGPTGTPTFAGQIPGAPPAAPAGGGQGAAGGGAAANRPPPEPRTFWTDEDAALCRQLTQRDARPGFPVTIRQPYYIGKYEVTQAQWKRVMGNDNPSVFQGSLVTDDADQHPVDNVTWDQAQAFIRRLNELDRTARYRLPTEFEWEWAAYAGSTNEPTWATTRAQAATGTKSTFRVGSKQPNAYGLYDMYGNVWEWVEDFYNEKLFPDPTPPRTGTQHVLKGASFIGDAKNFTPATHAAGPAAKWDVGFRVVRDAR